jgi:hypothetical protein
MKKSTIYGMVWSAWLGYWLANLGYGFLTWEFWFVFVPVIIFTNLEKKAFNEE